jgi:hypothetical protein
MANFLEGLDEIVFGGARERDRRSAEKHDLSMERMRQVIESGKADALLDKARAVALEQGRDISGRTAKSVDPKVQAAIDLGKIADARNKFGTDIDPDTDAFFKDATENIRQRVGFVKPVAEGSPLKQKTDKAIAEANAALAEAEQKLGKQTAFKKGMGVRPKRDIRADFTEGVDALDPDKIDTSKIAHGSTPDFPESNVPKTFDQLGLTSTDDQATLQEMQDTLPDIDMKQEFEQNPEGMKRLMKLLKDKKINKAQLKQFFSKRQEAARQTLGLA